MTDAHRGAAVNGAPSRPATARSSRALNKGWLCDHLVRFRVQEGGRLFLTAKGEPFAGPNTLNVILQRIAARIGLRKVHPHRWGTNPPCEAAAWCTQPLLDHAGPGWADH